MKELHKMFFLCSFCSLKDETPYHVLFECCDTNYLWNQMGANAVTGIIYGTKCVRML